MKRILSVVAGVMLVGVAAARADEAATTAPAGATTAVNTVKVQTTCPVMKGSPINKNKYVDFEGKRIYVCCGGCVATVKKDPAKYVKEMEAAGITLEKVPVAAPAAEKKP